MCGPDKNDMPRHKFSNARGLNLEEIFDPNVLTDELNTVTPEDGRLFGPNTVLPCLPSAFHFKSAYKC